MKATRFTVALSAALFLASGVAQAESEFSKNSHQNNFTSKRPYSQPLPESAYQKNDQWEGATLINQEDRAAGVPSKQQQMRINMLGKQPYMEKTGE